MHKNITQRVAANVRAELARKELRQDVVMSALHISQSAVSRRLKGHVDFTVTELAIIADLVGIDARDLLGSQAVAA